MGEKMITSPDIDAVVVTTLDLFHKEEIASRKYG